ncbi:MAG TPA: SOS response-associated peptidase family protein [Rhodanobacteraceae bacterium]|nr:SOS response-associated peptidase family protein [Rhodanobacteraceae bacterium]
MDHRKFERKFGTTLIVQQYVKFFTERIERGTWRKIPKGLKDAFAKPRNDDERRLLELIAEGDADEARTLEMELFKLKARLEHAERTLQKKTTEETREQALNDRGSVPAKIEAVQKRLADLRRTESLERDSRIFPGQYAPVMIVQDGRRTVVPMRYHCRLPGWTAFVERQYPDSYNARRENLEKMWSKLFGHRHGVMVAEAFFGSAPRGRTEQRELATGDPADNTALEFRPNPPRLMLVSCLWNFSPRSTPEERDIFSFATITDVAPPEIAAAGHERCIVPLKPKNLDAWLNPDADDLEALHAILDDRDRLRFKSLQAA